MLWTNILLVIIGGIYVYWTWRMAQYMETQRKASIRPCVIFRIDDAAENRRQEVPEEDWKASFVNVGLGIALNVHGWVGDDAATQETAESIGLSDSHFIRRPGPFRNFDHPPRLISINYENVEGDIYHSYLDQNGQWKTGKEARRVAGA